MSDPASPSPADNWMVDVKPSHGLGRGNDVDQVMPGGTANPPGLPTEAGFYWWRSSAGDPWRMVHVLNFAEGIREKPHLVTYDVQCQSWMGRDLNAWASHFKVGEWVRVLPPSNRQST